MYFSYGRGFQKEEFAKSEIPPMAMMGGDVSFIYRLHCMELYYRFMKLISRSEGSGVSGPH